MADQGTADASRADPDQRGRGSWSRGRACTAAASDSALKFFSKDEFAMSGRADRTDHPDRRSFAGRTRRRRREVH